MREIRTLRAMWRGLETTHGSDTEALSTETESKPSRPNLRSIGASPRPTGVKDLVDDWLHSAGISNGKIFRRVTRAGTVWGSGLTEKVVWHLSGSTRGKPASTNLRRTISGEPAPDSVIRQAVNSTRFNFYLDTCRCRPPNDILAASSGFATLSTIASGYSRNAEWVRTASGRVTDYA